MNSKTINSFSAWTVDRLISVRRATLTMLATFLIAITAQTAWAQTYEDIGTIKYNSELGAYEINCVNNLNDLAVYVNGSGTYSNTGETETVKHNCKDLTFKMTADITFPNTGDNNFTPIGGINLNFLGTFDGQGHTISGIRIDKSGLLSNDDYIGIFGVVGETVGDPKVKNLVVSNCSFAGDTYVGAIAGELIGKGIIENCHVGDGVTISGHLYVGGIVGSCSSWGTIRGCTCAAIITGTESGGNEAHDLGGIVGYIPSTSSDNKPSLTNNIFTGAINGGVNLGVFIGAIVGEPAGGILSNNLYTSTGFGGIGRSGSTIGGDGVGAKRAYTITGGEKVTVDFAGDATTTYSPNGISVYGAGIAGMKYANTLYVDGTAAVNVLLSSDDPVNSYSASAGTLTGTAITGSKDAYTLAMANPVSNITITADFALWGEKDGADGSEAKPYTISTTAGLDKLAQRVNAGNDAVVNGFSGKYFKLGDNIAYDKNTANNFTPIGDNNHIFYGTFDGDGKTISGININSGGAEYQGIFGYVSGTVKNLVVSNCSIVAYQKIGAIAGILHGTIENCHVGNDVTLSSGSSYAYAGGIVGSCERGTIKGCTCAATITGTNNAGDCVLGGIVGATTEYASTSSKLTDNIFTGRITGNLGDYIGAIVGKNDNGTLTNNLYTSEGLGGVGIASGSEQSTTGSDGAGARKALTVTFPTNGIPSGTATEYNVSGITGYTGKSGYDDTTVNNIILYNDGTTSTYYSGAGESVIFLYNYDGYQVSVKDADAGNVDFTKDIKQTDATHIYHNHTFTMPAKAVTITATDVWGVAGGKDGSTADNAYTITGTEGLDLLAQKVNAGTSYEGKYFKLGDNIAYDKDKENNFTPISYVIVDENNQAIERPFRGHFDGNGKTISGINLNNSVVDDHGIFGYLYGTVKNLVVSNCSIVADHNIGAIVGVLYGTIENCHVGSDVTLSGHSHVGGIAGWCADATIKGCTSAATIKGITNSGSNANNLGGIVGATNGPSSSLTDNLFTGAITGDLGQYIGAIFGWGNEYATLTNNVYTSAGFGGIGAKGSATGSDGAGARKAVVIGAAEGVTITPTGEATTYNVSGITTYKENTVLGYDSKLYAGATDAVKLSIANTGTPETGYEFSGFTAGEGVTITSSENVYTLTVPASDVTVDVVYQAIIYNITYKGVEDDEDNPEAYTVANESFTLSNPSREGYVFAGWTYEGQTEPTKTVTIAKGSTGDKTFTANWEKLLTNTDITVSTIADQTYTGSEIKPAITVKDGTTDITDQCDFTYNSNKVVGTAEVVISAKESSATYAGEKTVTFKIAPKTVSTPTITLSGTSFEYTGEAIKPTVTVKDGETTIPAEEYTVGYSNNIEDGTATVTITDNEGGNYTVSGTATFTITPKPNTAVVNVEETPVAIGGEVYYKSSEDIYEKMMYKAKGISIGLSAKASNRIEVTAEGVKFSKGTSTTMAMLNLKFGDIIKLFFRGIIRFNDDGSIFIVKSLTRGDGDTSSDGMIDLVSGAEYKVLKDGALVLTIVLENEEAVIEGISVTRAGTSTDEPTSIVVTAKNKYWTFSCDQDVKVPEGVKVYTCQLNSNGTKAIITELSATELGGVIKANNGVLLSSDPGDYTFVFSPETTSTAKTYENNALVAVVKPTHLSPNDYYVLKDNEFHVILDDETEVPANKAVLKKPTGASGSRAIGIDEGDDATRIWGVGVADEDAVWYTVSGQRIDKPTKKGLYIKNGVKVVVK